MSNNTTPPTPALTRDQLRHILQVVRGAHFELCEMIEVWEMTGDLNAIWRMPREYFAPEDNGSQFPYPNEYLLSLVQPVWEVSESAKPDCRELTEEIISFLQFFGLARGKSLRSGSL